MNNLNNISLEKLENGCEGEKYYYVKDFTVNPEINDKTIVCDLFIKTLNMPELTDWNEVDTPFISELIMIPRLEFITKQNIEKIIDFSGFDEKLIKEDAKYFQLEVISYGMGIRLAGGDESFSNEKEAIEALKKDVFACTLIGFYLDKSWNRIGTTGWDSLNEIVNNQSAIQATIQRMRVEK